MTESAQGLMQGKQGIIFGVSNTRSIGYGIAKALHAQGAEIAFTYAGEVMESRVRPIAEKMGSKCIVSCDVTKEEDIKATFEAYNKAYDKLDFVIHSVAFANREDITGRFSEISRDGWNLAMDISAYSLIPIAREARKLMTDGGSILAMSYLGGERSVPNYNLMGVAKAALEANVRYLAAELGEEEIRVNALSAGPVKTLAAKGIGGFDILLKINAVRSPMKRNITLDEVGNSGLYLASDLSTGVTGEVHHVDCGFHSIALCKDDARIIGIDPDEHEAG
mgnify:CR=1 FL=1